MSEHVDVVVIGAGLGGLAAAVTAAGQGKRTLVLEQSDTPGGYAVCFQRGPYRFDASLHAWDGLAPGGGSDAVLRELGIWDRLRLRRLDPLYVVRTPNGDMVAHADLFRYESELIRLFPNQLLGIRSYLDEAWEAFRDARRFGEDRAAGRSGEPREFMTRYPAMARLNLETWERTLTRHVSDPRARAALAALWGYFTLPPSRLSGFVGVLGSMSYHLFGGWYPEGGSGALSHTLEQALQERGGEIRYSQRVTGMEIKSGRVAAVSTAEGLRVEADTVISNASAPTTMLEFVGRQHLPADYQARVETPAASSATFAVYLGLNRDVFKEQGLPHEVFLSDRDPDASWQASQSGDWEHAGLGMTDYTSVDPTCAPPGSGVVVLGTLASWDYENVWGTGGDLTDYHHNPRYQEIKERVADTLVARAARYAPGLMDAIQYREVSTPLSNFSHTRNPRGAIEGYENSSENTGMRWLPQTTPIQNLFLAGAWTNTGGQTAAMMSGISAARLALEAPTPVAP